MKKKEAILKMYPQNFFFKKFVMKSFVVFLESTKILKKKFFLKLKTLKALFFINHMIFL